MSDIEEIENTIAILNSEFFEQNESFMDDYGLRVELYSCGDARMIKFLDYNLWNDVDDDRDWISEDEQEDLVTYLRREINELLSGLNTLKLEEAG